MEAKAVDKFVVVGVDTPIGAGLAQALQDRCEVFGISSRPVVGGDDHSTRCVRRDDCRQLVATIEELDPDCLIYTGSLSASSWDLPTSDIAWQYESATAESLVSATRQLNAKLIAVSSDVVFVGPKMFHDEGAPTTSSHPAASAVTQWEQILLAGGALVTRAHGYGWAPAGADPGLIERIADALRAGTCLPIDGQRHATPILAADLAPLLQRAAERDLTGLYHLSGAERTSTYRLASQLASILGVPMSRDHNRPREAATDGSWLVETSLDSRRARRALDMPLPMLCEGLQRFAELHPDGHRKHDARPLPVEQAA
jgi:dTDP-4-dehydrorhamnose reductase